MEGSRFGAYPRETPRYLSRRVHVRKLFKQAAPASVSRRVSAKKRKRHKKEGVAMAGPKQGCKGLRRDTSVLFFAFFVPFCGYP